MKKSRFQKIQFQTRFQKIDSGSFQENPVFKKSRIETGSNPWSYITQGILKFLYERGVVISNTIFSNHLRKYWVVHIGGVSVISAITSRSNATVVLFSNNYIRGVQNTGLGRKNFDVLARCL